ncbi:MAG: hypothetical protein ABI780_00975 [Ardenticatenales bacterium]
MIGPNGLGGRGALRAVALMIAAAALLPAWPTAHAEEQSARVRSLYLSGSADGTPPPQGTEPSAEPVLFDAGTRAVFAHFSYEEAADQSIGVLVKGRGGVTCFSHTAKYNGNGSVSIEISGATAYAVLTAGLNGDARDAKQSAKQAAERSVGVQEFLRAAEAAVLRLQWTVDLLGNVVLPPEPTKRVDEIVTRLEQARSILSRAIELPADDVTGKQGRAAQVDTMLGDVVLASATLSEEAPSMTDLALPRSGHAAADAFVVQLEIDGDIAASAEFWVWGPARIYLPQVSKRVAIR